MLWRILWVGLLGPALLAVVSRAESSRAVGDQATVQIAGADYVDVALFLGRYNLSSTWIEPSKRQRFSSVWTEITLEVDSREISYNGLRVFMGSGAVLRDGRIWIDRIDAEKLFAPLLKPATFAAEARPVRRIVIDPGHGGRDGGTANRKHDLNEKTSALDVSRRLRDLLKAQGFEIVMTREDDRYLGLAERATIGREQRADLFVSVHFNAAVNAEVHGTETYVMTPRHQRSTSSSQSSPDDGNIEPGNANDAWNVVLGLQMHRSLRQHLALNDRGLKRARFAVLRLAECPAVLVESAYLSNDTEALKVASPAYRGEIAQAIANGVIAYANLVLSTRTP